MARPKKNISAKAVFELAKIGCTLEEMGRVLGCNATTIGRRFRKEVERGMANLKVRLRRKQISEALTGNIAMLIWLGKQLLDQTERNRTELAGQVETPITLSVEELDANIRELLAKAGLSVEAVVEGTEATRNPAALQGETEN
jgi:hypothetical protein